LEEGDERKAFDDEEDIVDFAEEVLAAIMLFTPLGDRISERRTRE
jgi:hypothetical protein